MKIYLWYDEMKRRYVTGRSSEFALSYDDVLYSFDDSQLSLSQKILNNLNRVR
ncbi:hypothetical protein [Ekhidna sp.]|uniref:hypothetical protein n=1 Tax=Ekhidna sp. TaxID=2608089 RepID=UPI003CCC1AC0